LFASSSVSYLIDERVWLRQGETWAPLDDGFLPDAPEPLRPFGAGQRLSTLSDQACLALIGEPGLGKTTAVRAAAAAAAAGLSAPDEVHLVELGVTQEESRLRELVFGSEPWQHWIAGTGTLHLFLDGFDEARLRIPTVGHVLRLGLAGAPTARLVLRLTCRTADRDFQLERELDEMFGGSFDVFELAPLTRGGVWRMAEAAGIDAGAFVSEVIAKRLQPMAMVPMTLRMLIDIAIDGDELPTEKAELYERACLRLCTDPDEDRRVLASPMMTETQRLAVATRTAAAILLSGKAMIRQDDETGDRDTASGRELAGGAVLDTAVAVATPVSVTTDHIKELLRYPLFSARAEMTLGFAQPTCAEYLCARALAHGGFEMDQIEDLLFAETPSGRRVIPQLIEVATWLAQIRPEFRQMILDDDPAAMLRSEPAGLSGREREAMVEALFSAIRLRELDTSDRVLRSNLHHLSHPGLLAQIRRVVTDPGEELVVREIALRLAEANVLSGLAGLVRGIALDATVPGRLRVAALNAISAIGSNFDHRKVGVLAVGDLGDQDPDDEIKGAALRALWPRHLTARQVFRALTLPKDPNFFGAYGLFLMQDLLEGLDDEDLPVALRWARTVAVTHDPTDSLSRLRDDLIMRCLPLAARDEIAKPLADVIARLLAEHAELASRPLRSKTEPAIEDVLTTDVRRRLILLLSPRIARGELNEASLTMGRPAIAIREDADWVLDELVGARGHLAVGLAHLAKALVWLGAFPERIVEVRASNRLLRALTAEEFDPVVVGSPEADQMRTRWERWQKLRAVRDEPEEPKVDVPALVAEQLRILRNGDLAGYWRAVYFTSVDPSTRHVNFTKSDLSDLPGWTSLNIQTQEELQRNALDYLVGYDPEPTKWFGANKGWRPAQAGYRALRVLHDQRAADTLPSGAWAKWAPAVVDWLPYGDGEQEFHRWAIDRCSREAPTSTAHWIGEALDKDLRDHNYAFVLQRMSAGGDTGTADGTLPAEQVWTPQLDAELKKRATQSKLDPKSRTQVLAFMLRRGSQVAHAHALQLVTVAAIKTGGRRRLLAEQVAALLAAELPGAAWDLLWPLIRRFPAFGKQVVLVLAADRDRSIAGQLSEREVADLWEWMLTWFPPAEDGHRAEAHFVEAREQLGLWRDNLVRSLVNRSTDEAVSELCRLRDRHPEYPYVRRFAAVAAENTRRRTWIAPPPKVIVQMTEDVSRRWVKSAADLRRILRTTISGLENRLQEGNQALYLWNDNPRRPKNEPAISHYIQEELKRDLRDRGVITGREVEIRPHPDFKMGESTDLLVSARADEYVLKSELVEAVVEVKGCWHQEVMMALRAQLIDRYLTDTGISHGIYVVGWFAADDWDPKDTRRAHCAKYTTESLQAALDKQARGESAATQTAVDAVVLDCSVAPRRGRASRRSPDPAKQ
jgi:hypothetical protein